MREAKLLLVDGNFCTQILHICPNSMYYKKEQKQKHFFLLVTILMHTQKVYFYFGFF